MKHWYGLVALIGWAGALSAGPLGCATQGDDDEGWGGQAAQAGGGGAAGYGGTASGGMGGTAGSGTGGGAAGSGGSGGSGIGAIVFSEIMYHPGRDEDDWEWVELYNGTSATIDLAGYVLDDNNTSVFSVANIAAGTIAPQQTAVLYNADDVSSGDFQGAWPSATNLVAVTGWNNLALNNSGDRLGLWESFADYEGDHVIHANAVVGLEYDADGEWPLDDGSSSIYLLDLGSDPSQGASWALSQDGVDGAYASGFDVGSPGSVP